MDCNNNTISIKIPVVKEYSQILRLTASGAFNQAGFDIDIIRDVKVVVSEVFNCMLQAKTAMCEVIFVINKEELIMEFSTCDEQEVLEGANDMTLPILEAFVNDVTTTSKGTLVLTINKV